MAFSVKTVVSVGARPGRPRRTARRGAGPSTLVRSPQNAEQAGVSQSVAHRSAPKTPGPRRAPGVRHLYFERNLPAAGGPLMRHILGRERDRSLRACSGTPKRILLLSPTACLYLLTAWSSGDRQRLCEDPDETRARKVRGQITVTVPGERGRPPSATWSTVESIVNPPGAE